MDSINSDQAHRGSPASSAMRPEEISNYTESPVYFGTPKRSVVTKPDAEQSGSDQPEEGSGLTPSSQRTVTGHITPATPPIKNEENSDSDSDSFHSSDDDNEQITAIISSQLSVNEKQAQILAVIKSNTYSDSNFLPQIPEELWNEAIVIAACMDDPNSLDTYFYSDLFWSNKDLILINNLIHAAGKLNQTKKRDSLMTIFWNLAVVDSMIQPQTGLKRFEIPEEIWKTGCKYLPAIVSFLPERYLNLEFLELAKRSGGIPFDVMRFEDVTLEDICLFARYPLECCRELEPYSSQKLRYMVNILGMKTQNVKHIGNPFVPFCVSYFTEPDRPVGRMSLTNRALPALYYTCFKNAGLFSPFRLKMGERLSAYIQKRSEQFDLESSAITVADSYFKPLSGGFNFYGNRSFVFQKGSQQFLFCKFLRSGEDVSQLTREMGMHEFITQNGSIENDSETNRFLTELKSRTPRPSGLFKIEDGSELARKIRSECQDQLHTHQGRDGKSYLVFYGFSSETAGYSQYANMGNTPEERTRAEEGILKAAHDLGLWASAGVLHNSIIQPFHSYPKLNFDSGRAWNFFNNNNTRVTYNSTCSLPGGMAFWRESLQKSDISVEGLRDLGDWVLFNQQADHSQKEILDMMKVVGNNVVAMTLLWCELNINCLDARQLERFVVAMLSQFIDGYFPPWQKNDLEELLNLTKSGYKESLAVAAEELCFWITHRQGSLTEAGRLYPNENHEFSQGDHLGTTEGLFPGTVLIKIVTRLCTQIVELSSDHNKA